MARDPLLVLHTVRQRAVEQARQALGTCLRNEAGIADRIGTLGDTMRRDRDAASTVEDAHRFLDIFATRLATIHADRGTAVADLAAAEARSAEARTAVVAARTAAEAVEQLIAERAAAARAEAARREQHVLDDIARARHVARHVARHD